jgi:RNA 3'-terminal phosphate cyclase
MLRYKGAKQFRQRILLSTLSGRAVRIDGIREADAQVGLRDYEANFLRMLEKVITMKPQHHPMVHPPLCRALPPADAGQLCP